MFSPLHNDIDDVQSMVWCTTYLTMPLHLHRSFIVKCNGEKFRTVEQTFSFNVRLILGQFSN